MSLEWSHTDSAYDNARENIGYLGTEELAVALAEIYASNHRAINSGKEWYPSFDSRRFKRVLPVCKRMEKARLSDLVWEFAKAYRTCDNSGSNAHICPFGCHKASFTRNPEMVISELMEDLEQFSYPGFPAIAVEAIGQDCFIVKHESEAVSFYYLHSDEMSFHFSILSEVGSWQQDVFLRHFQQNKIDVETFEIEVSPWLCTRVINLNAIAHRGATPSPAPKGVGG